MYKTAVYKLFNDEITTSKQ